MTSKLNSTTVICKHGELSERQVLELITTINHRTMKHYSTQQYYKTPLKVNEIDLTIFSVAKTSQLDIFKNNPLLFYNRYFCVRMNRIIRDIAAAHPNIFIGYKSINIGIIKHQFRGYRNIAMLPVQEGTNQTIARFSALLNEFNNIANNEPKEPLFEAQVG